MKNHLKILKDKSNDQELRVANHIALYGGMDLHGEHFTPETKFESDYTKHNAVLVDWEHGFDYDPDSPDEDDLLGYVDWSTAKSTDYGLWVERVLDRSKEYMEFIEMLIEEGVIATSSEAVPKNIRRSESGEIQVWPIKRDSLTVQPAEPRMLTSNVLAAIKALSRYSPALKSLLPEDAQESVEEPEADAAANRTDKSDHKERKNTMADEVNVITRDEFARWQDEIKAELSEVKGFSAKVDTLLQRLESTPAAKKAGVIAPDSEEDHEQAKSFGDFLIAISNNNVKRLTTVYKSTKGGRMAKALGTTDGSSGGWLTPVEYATDVFGIAEKESPILSQVTTVPVGAAAGRWPALDNYVTPAVGSGETAKAAGVKAASHAEGTETDETEPGFVELDWRIREHGGNTPVNNELMRYSPVAIEMLLKDIFGIAVRSKKEMMVIRGNGTTQYLGILNSAAAIPISPDTNSLFAYADMLEMRSRFRQIKKTPVWLAHDGMIPDIGQFEIGTNGAGVPRGVGSPEGLETMPGTPFVIYYNEHMPQDDTAGCVILADLGAYTIFQSEDLEIAFSEHANFTKNQSVWRFLDYSDGMPWLKNVITLADPTGSYTVSPFVYFND